jgi:hypothetical protein
MAAISNQPQGQSWRDTAIERSEGITDAWEVTKTYAGRLAEWILFLCMIANIIEMLPGVALAAWLTNTIMGVQVVMLDVGGFSLASMGDQARENGDERAANKARATGYLLIAIMIITLLLVSVGILWPALPQVAGSTVDASSEPGDRVKAFLQQWSSPKKPTIQVIMDACQVAKKTATRYREDFYGLATSSQNDDEE